MYTPVRIQYPGERPTRRAPDQDSDRFVRREEQKHSDAAEAECGQPHGQTHEPLSAIVTHPAPFARPAAMPGGGSRRHW